MSHVRRLLALGSIGFVGSACSGGSAPDAGPAVCGASNFTACAGACANLSVCQVNNVCVCNADTVALDCSGQVCNGGCRAPNWWCVPRDAGACGPVNFTVPHTTADGGVGHCPTDGVYVSGGCECPTDFTELSCTGVPCNVSPCTYPNYWCVARDAGACGPVNFTVACNGDAGIFHCPSNGVCNGDGCGCAAGHVASDCNNTPCAGHCAFPNWWCP